MSLRTFSRVIDREPSRPVPILWQVYDKLMNLPAEDFERRAYAIIANDLLAVTNPRDHRANVERLSQNLPAAFAPVIEAILKSCP